MRAPVTGVLPHGATRARLALTGLVQGVGFRPWVAVQARRLGLHGWVRNTGGGVELEVEGTAGAVAALVNLVTGPDAPGLVARAALLPSPASSVLPSSSFEICLSDDDTRGAWIGADTAVCARCLEELFNPGDRRHLHPFIHCPRCGPRFAIQRGVPFDRARTSLADFAECAACLAEKSDPRDRRFHDQTNACPACGPRLWLRHKDGAEERASPIAEAVSLLARGGVLAMKGVGGFHLTADARNEDAIDRIRAFKARPTRPLAIMAANAASLLPWVEIGPHERATLESAARPIVLLRRHGATRSELPRVAPGQAWLGAMLPYAPVHHLMFWHAAGWPRDVDARAAAQPTLWVMTSANRRGEPLLIDNDDACAALVGVVDGWLLHDRDIVARADDSVVRVRDDGSVCMLRRARGFAPLPVSSDAPSFVSSNVDGGGDHAVLALGADLKATVCVARVTGASAAGRGGRIDWVVSPHAGSVHTPESRVAFAQLVERWRSACGARLVAVACDRHPDFFSARLAAEVAENEGAENEGVPLIEVGHHHAHVAAVIAEQLDPRAWETPVIALALDGFGRGDDDRAWGGELLRVHGDACERIGHLWPLALPGGDRAAREPWRLAAAALVALGLGDHARARFPDEPLAEAVARLSSLQETTTTTSLGRLFDAVAALLGGPCRTTFEGEAPQWLESRAIEAAPGHDEERSLWSDTPGGLRVLDWRPLLSEIAHTACADPQAQARAARRFHDDIAAALAAGAAAAAHAWACGTVVLAGGCLANRLLDEEIARRLRAAGLRVWRATQWPVGDGAISVGQAWVALHRLAHRSPSR